MLQHDRPEDFVIATGEQHSVRDFVVRAALELGISIDWQGEGLNEVGIVSAAPAGSAAKVGQRIVGIDPRYRRPAEVETLLGDPSKARALLGWTPRTGFADLVAEMMRADLALAQRDELIRRAGFQAFDHHE
jgi:GDPmannose 4,6-dehydratase